MTHTMNFLRNTWYCAGWPGDVGREPITKTFLGEPVLMYRTEAGQPVAMSNRCPHRFAPLHRGKLKGDSIECPYHGLQFNTSGRCVLNPHGDGAIPKAAHLQRYPLVEKDGVLWLWMGDVDRADESKIIDTPFMLQPDTYAVGTGHLLVKANYLLVMDNLLDLTHAPFVHENSLGGSIEDNRGLAFRLQDDETSVTSHYSVMNRPPPPQLMALYPHPSGDLRISMQWHPASSLIMRLSMTPCGEADGTGLASPLLHLLTPQDESTTHYFFALGRNVNLHDEDADAWMLAGARAAFELEDEPMIAACQAQMGTTDLYSLKPVLLPTDVAAVRVRRRLDRLLADQGVSPAPAWSS